jgi:hypothetical protein
MGAGGVIIILKNVKEALSVGVTSSGKYKVWHCLVLTHVAAFLAGLAF